MYNYLFMALAVYLLCRQCFV